MSRKKQGMEAVNRILEIRQFFPKATVEGKKSYAQQYKQAILKLIAYLKVQKNQDLISKLPELEKQLKQFKHQIEQEEFKMKKNSQIKEAVDSQQSKGRKAPNEMQNSINDAIVRQKPNIKWTDVLGLDQAKKCLQQAVILPVKFPQVFVGQRTPWKGILLYGPPGTGKTFLAKACATEMKGGTFFSISSSDLMSKYVGQSQKTLKTLFKVARQQKPSIIFIDEIDSIAGERSQDENEVSRRVKTQLLIQMQGVGNDCKGILVLGATNLPWSIDSAVRRRFQKRVYIPLPDVKARIAMMRVFLKQNDIELTPIQMKKFLSLTQGFSGSDMSNLTNDALMNPIRCLEKTNTWEQVLIDNDIKYAPFHSDKPKDPSKVYFSGSMYDLKDKGYTIHLTTTFDDIKVALQKSRPSVNSDDLEKYIQFTNSFGMDG